MAKELDIDRRSELALNSSEVLQEKIIFGG